MPWAEKHPWPLTPKYYLMILRFRRFNSRPSLSFIKHKLRKIQARLMGFLSLITDLRQRRSARLQPRLQG